MKLPVEEGRAGRTPVKVILTVCIVMGLYAGCSDNEASDAGPDVWIPDAALLDAVVDARQPEGPSLDAGAPDAPQPDAGIADDPSLDAGTPDAVQPDSMAADTNSSDGGQVPGTWVNISAGTFMMGSPTSERCRDSNEDQHPVTLTKGFEIQSTEVTQAQFQAIMGYNPSYFGPNGYGASCGPACPVDSVAWHEAAAYCNALSQRARIPACYNCTGSGTSVTCSQAVAYSGQSVYACPGYRLPTEAEWEYAYRAGTQTAFYNGPMAHCYAFDANAEKIGWYFANAKLTTHRVGQKLENPWHLHDMAGNVWEHCHDWYRSSLGSSAVTDPFGPSSGSYRVARGGSWNFLPTSLRAAYRFWSNPTVGDAKHGFRCARTK